MRYVLAVLIALVLSGCAATQQELRSEYSDTIGQPIDLMIRSWGPPTGVYQTPSGAYTVYTWIQMGPVETVIIPGRYGTYAQTGQDQCRSDWTVNRDGIIIDFKFNGACRIGN